MIQDEVTKIWIILDSHELHTIKFHDIEQCLLELKIRMGASNAPCVMIWLRASANTTSAATQHGRKLLSFHIILLSEDGVAPWLRSIMSWRHAWCGSLCDISWPHWTQQQNEIHLYTGWVGFHHHNCKFLCMAQVLFSKTFPLTCRFQLKQIVMRGDHHKQLHKIGLIDQTGFAYTLWGFY